MLPFDGRLFSLKLGQCEFAKQRGGKCIEGIPGTWSDHCTPPRSIAHSQKRKNAGANQGTLSRSGGTQHQDEGLLGRCLALQSIKHFADGFRSAVVESCMFEIEEIQPPKWVRFQITDLSQRFPRVNFPIQLLCEEIAKMLSKQIFELFQILIVMAAFAKLCFTILFPCRAKLPHRVPLSAQVFPFFFRFERSSRSRSIPVNVQPRKPRSSLHLIQYPGNFVFGCGSRWASVRQDEHRRGPGSELRPENANDKVILARIQDVLAILWFRLGVLMLREAGT